LGNANGKLKVLKVCNPYCTPCAKGHRLLNTLLESDEEISLQIIFSTTRDESHRTNTAVRHFLSLAEMKNSKLLKSALDDWYLTEKKDYTLFDKKYPLSSSKDEINKQIESMNNWCELNEITYTPTYFVNGFRLPEEYEIADLKYFY
jgi:protein-disulfide isomerase